MLTIVIGLPLITFMILLYNQRRGLLNNAKHISRYGTARPIVAS
jgi:hypothetical protein